MARDPLFELAREAGLLLDWIDFTGARHEVSRDSLRAILDSMGLPCGTERMAEESRVALAEANASAAQHFVCAEVGQTFEIPGAARAVAGAVTRLILENGEQRDMHVEMAGPNARLPPIDVPGYHRLALGSREIQIAIAPSRAFSLSDLAGSRRLWGSAVQTYSLHGDRREAFGDFGTLAELVRGLAAEGADAVMISPAHALFDPDGSRYSPYAPSTRLFLNPAYADPDLLSVGDEALQPEHADELIDWSAAIPEKLRRLRNVYERFRSQAGAQQNAFEEYRESAGADLLLHAHFQALHDFFFTYQGARSWQEWPRSFQRPDAPEVAEFAHAHGAEIDFQIFLQWLTGESFSAAQDAATSAGMRIGLIADLAVGMDPGGSHAWSRPDEVLSGLRIGAPPDLIQPAGQDWGLTTLSPAALRRSAFLAFRETLQSAIRHAGGVRVDHAMGLRRIWVIPEGASSADGAYLTYPFEEMLALLTLESFRARAVVVAEDLGTVPPGFSETLNAKGILGMRVLWFERDGNADRFAPPQTYPRDAIALTTTHDLPTVAGWWSGRDIEWNAVVGHEASPDEGAEAKAQRARDRQQLWSACVDAQTAEGDPPPPDRPDAAVDAAVSYVAATESQLAIIPLEDLLALPEQPNLPGTTDEHPNWKRRLPLSVSEVFADPAVKKRVDRIRRMRTD